LALSCSSRYRSLVLNCQWSVLWLVIGAVFFTFRMGFVNVWGFKHAIQLVRGDYANSNDSGEVSHFQALATAVSGTVSIGNIGGVAVAVTVGGPRGHILADHGWLSRHVDQVRRVYPWHQIPDRKPRRVCVWWTDVLSPQRVFRVWDGGFW